MHVEKVTGSVYYLSENPGEVNVGVVVTPGGTLLVDTGSSLEMGLEVQKQVTALTDQPVCYIINTHHHADHVSGNGAFETQILAHISCYHHMLKKMSTRSRLEALGDPDSPHPGEARPALPSLCFSDRGFLFVGGLLVELYHAPGHTEGSVVVNIPSERVVFGGDSFSIDPVQVDETSDFDRWIASVSLVRRLAPRFVIPGRGDAYGYAGLDVLDSCIRVHMAGDRQVVGGDMLEKESGVIRIAPRVAQRSQAAKSGALLKGVNAR